MIVFVESDCPEVTLPKEAESCAELGTPHRAVVAQLQTFEPKQWDGTTKNVCKTDSLKRVDGEIGQLVESITGERQISQAHTKMDINSKAEWSVPEGRKVGIRNRSIAPGFHGLEMPASKVAEPSLTVTAHSPPEFAATSTPVGLCAGGNVLLQAVVTVAVAFSSRDFLLHVHESALSVSRTAPTQQLLVRVRGGGRTSMMQCEAESTVGAMLTTSLSYSGMVRPKMWMAPARGHPHLQCVFIPNELDV
mmetsp:Transcript_42155/g.91608  ORF Transcript_42155/g.91608 Transcript_42155/m.91608 type:complete len:249 (-) Transcript_42155:615-1361(-)